MQKYASNTLDGGMNSVYYTIRTTSILIWYLLNLQKIYTLTIFQNCIERPNFVCRL